jgi:proton-translocating NAD(P)+ transhydrogenase subunit alpha
MIPMKIGVPREIAPGERRVALVPDTVARLSRSGSEVLVQQGAGEDAFFSDQEYRAAGATVHADAVEVLGGADVVVKVRPPTTNPALGRDEVDLLRGESTLIGILQPALNQDLATRLRARRITAFSMDAIPRIARAQSMDVLSSQSSIAGYKAVLIAASALGKFLPLMMTAAGTLAPAKVLVMGTGVAGLQAIATARRLGAAVQGYDIRPVAREQVESLGATFVTSHVVDQTETAGGYARELAEDAQRRERDLVRGVVSAADVVITTALIPGRRAPTLVTADMVAAMQPGSVIIDIAADMGGNCELTQPGETVLRHGVEIHGPTNLASTMPIHASQMYSRNIHNLLLHLMPDGQLQPDFDDVITRECCITHEGEVQPDTARAPVAAAA